MRQDIYNRELIAFGRSMYRTHEHLRFLHRGGNDITEDRVQAYSVAYFCERTNDNNLKRKGMAQYILDNNVNTKYCVQEYERSRNIDMSPDAIEARKLIYKDLGKTVQFYADDKIRKGYFNDATIKWCSNDLKQYAMQAIAFNEQYDIESAMYEEDYPY